MTGFALGIYRFRGKTLLIFFMFIAGNFVPFQILMVPGPRPDREHRASTTQSSVPSSLFFTSRSRPGSARSSNAQLHPRAALTS